MIDEIEEIIYSLCSEKGKIIEKSGYWCYTNRVGVNRRDGYVTNRFDCSPEFHVENIVSIENENGNIVWLCTPRLTLR